MGVETKTLTLTYADILNIHKCFFDLFKIKGNIYYSFAIAKNIKVLEQIIDPIQTAISPHDDFKKYEELRKNICEKNCKRDINGEVLSHNGTYIFDDEILKIVNEQIEQLKEEYKTALIDRENQVNEYNIFLKEESTIQLCCIQFDHFPETVSPEEIYPLVNHELLI